MGTESKGPFERYLKILEVVAASRDGLQAPDIATVTGFPKPTVYRLCQVLLDNGAIIADGSRQKSYKIGPRLWRILYLGLDEGEAANYAQVVCDELARELNETVYVVRLGLDDISSIARSAPDRGYRLHVFPGSELPAHAAASAKAILAFQDEQTVDRFLKPPLMALTDYTTTDVDAVKRELELIREQGSAVCDREIDRDVMAFAAPVKLRNAGVLFSVGVTGPRSRLLERDGDYWIAALKNGSKRLSAALDSLRKREGRLY